MEGLCRMKIVRLSNPMESGMIILAKIVLIIYVRGSHVSIIFYLFFHPVLILSVHVKNDKKVEAATGGVL